MHSAPPAVPAPRPPACPARPGPSTPTAQQRCRAARRRLGASAAAPQRSAGGRKGGIRKDRSSGRGAARRAALCPCAVSPLSPPRCGSQAGGDRKSWGGARAARRVSPGRPRQQGEVHAVHQQVADGGLHILNGALHVALQQHLVQYRLHHLANEQAVVAPHLRATARRAPRLRPVLGRWRKGRRCGWLRRCKPTPSAMPAWHAAAMAQTQR